MTMMSLPEYWIVNPVRLPDLFVVNDTKALLPLDMMLSGRAVPLNVVINRAVALLPS